MKLHLTEQDGNRITAYRDRLVYINGDAHSRSLLLFSDKIIIDWPARDISEVTQEMLEETAELCRPGMVVLLGAGNVTPPINPRWQEPFSEKQAVLEIMSLPAACRTYNFLNGDGRLVMAALIIAKPDKIPESTAHNASDSAPDSTPSDQLSNATHNKQ